MGLAGFHQREIDAPATTRQAHPGPAEHAVGLADELASGISVSSSAISDTMRPARKLSPTPLNSSEAGPIRTRLVLILKLSRHSCASAQNVTTPPARPRKSAELLEADDTRRRRDGRHAHVRLAQEHRFEAEVARNDGLLPPRGGVVVREIWVWSVTA